MMKSISTVRAFFNSALQDAARPLVDSMNWDADERNVQHGRRVEVPACTQTSLAAVTVERTITLFYSFRVTNYYWRVVPPEWWKFSKGGDSPTWLNIVKSESGDVMAQTTGFGAVYSSGGYVRVESVCQLLPNNFITAQVHHTPLPPEECE
jgi:hypothetical protein